MISNLRSNLLNCNYLVWLCTKSLMKTIWKYIKDFMHTNMSYMYRFLSLTQVRGLTDTCSVWRPWWRRRVGGSRNCSLTPPTRNWTTSSCLPPRCLVLPFWLEDLPQWLPTGLEWVSFPIIPCPLFLLTVISRTVEQFNVSQHRIRNSKGLREMDKGRMKGTGK